MPPLDFSFSVIVQSPTILVIEPTFNEDLFGSGREKLFVTYQKSSHVLNATAFNGTSYYMNEEVDTNSAEYKAASSVGYFGSGSVIVAILTSVGASIFLEASNESMWIMINAFQIIYLTLAMSLFFSVLMMRMFSMLAFLNMENEFLAGIFLYNINEAKLSSEPLSDGFARVGYQSTSLLVNGAEIFASWEIAIPALGLLLLL